MLNVFLPAIEQAANKFLKPGQSAADHGGFFGRFTPIWFNLVQRRRYFDAIHLWNSALKIVYAWEDANKPNLIHKGTPFYFMGVTAILNNELENGFLLMHQALEEDKKLSTVAVPKTPAYSFVTLDYKNQHQFFRPKVEEISKYLVKAVETYTKTRPRKITLNDFKTKFLECGDLTEEVFLFAFVMFRTHKILNGTDDRLKKNVFSSFIHSEILSDLCLIFDKTSENKNPQKGKAKLFISNEIKLLSAKASSKIDDYAVGKISDDFKIDFAKTLTEILQSKYSLPLQDIENDLAIAYGIRNFAAHRIEDQPVLYNEFGELSQRLLNALFFAVENLY